MIIQPEYMHSINSFIEWVFNYYNGRINTCNVPARLQIEWANLESSTNGGVTKNPDIVTINPHVIARYNDTWLQFDFCIIETIIHELFHIDQIIDYGLMAFSKDYVKAIEYPVEIQTNIYLANHLNELRYEFGLDIAQLNNEVRRVIAHYELPNAHYQRRRYHDHICILLSEMYFGEIAISSNTGFGNISSILSNIITYNITNGKNAIIVRIGDNTLQIQNGTQLTPIRIVNDFFYENYFKYDYRGYSEAYMYTDNNDTLWILIENPKCSNIMVKPV